MTPETSSKMGLWAIRIKELIPGPFMEAEMESLQKRKYNKHKEDRRNRIGRYGITRKRKILVIGDFLLRGHVSRPDLLAWEMCCLSWAKNGDITDRIPKLIKPICVGLYWNQWHSHEYMCWSILEPITQPWIRLTMKLSRESWRERRHKSWSL